MFALGRLRGRLGRVMPQEAARETDSAVESREGDVFGPETFALAMFRDRQAQGLPRDAPRGTDSAAESPKGDVFGPETFALGAFRGRLLPPRLPKLGYNTRIMTGNQLKILALLAMTVDHIGVVIFPQVTVLRVIGRLAYPIFAYMIAEGCFYTHDKRRYLGGIVALGTACQLVYFFALGSLEQSILSTFALSIVTVYAVQLADSRRDVRGTLALAGALALDAFVCWGLPSLLRPSDFSIDYGFWGVLLPVLSYLPRVLVPAARRSFRHVLAVVFMAGGLVLVALTVPVGGTQWWGLATVPLLLLYNGKRGTWKMKHLFYIYYPAHLVVIYGISLLL